MLMLVFILILHIHDSLMSSLINLCPPRSRRGSRRPFKSPSRTKRGLRRKRVPWEDVTLEYHLFSPRKGSVSSVFLGNRGRKSSEWNKEILLIIMIFYETIGNLLNRKLWKLLPRSKLFIGKFYFTVRLLSPVWGFATTPLRTNYYPGHSILCNYLGLCRQWPCGTSESRPVSTYSRVKVSSSLHWWDVEK